MLELILQKIPGGEDPPPRGWAPGRPNAPAESRLLQSTDNLVGPCLGLRHFLRLALGIRLQTLIFGGFLEVKADSADGIGVMGDDSVGTDEIFVSWDRQVIGELFGFHVINGQDDTATRFAVIPDDYESVSHLDVGGFCRNNAFAIPGREKDAMVFCYNDLPATNKVDLE